MNFELRKILPDDWEEFVRLINHQWKYNHPITKKALFDWQFEGYGNEANAVKSLVLFHNKKMIGFRGVIPGIYQVPKYEGEMEIIHGGSLSMWVIDEKYRGQKLGLRMHLAVQEMLSVITGAGSSFNTSVPIYKKNGFLVKDSINRYIVPLDVNGYLQLLGESSAAESIQRAFNVPESTRVELPLIEPNFRAFEDLWRKRSFAFRLFSLYRSREFYQWRYSNNPGFVYLFFGDVNIQGFVVARIEESESNISSLSGIKVLRIIEIVPNDMDAWEGRFSKVTRDLLLGVISYAKGQGCVAADFYSSFGRFDKILYACGFKQQKIIERNNLKYLSHSIDEYKLPAVFAPYIKYAEPINVLYRIFDRSKKMLLDVDIENTYIVKSENDMDRPNKLKEDIHE